MGDRAQNSAEFLASICTSCKAAEPVNRGVNYRSLAKSVNKSTDLMSACLRFGQMYNIFYLVNLHYNKVTESNSKK